MADNYMQGLLSDPRGEMRAAPTLRKRLRKLRKRMAFCRHSLNR